MVGHLKSSVCNHPGGYGLDIVSGYKVLWPLSLHGWIVAPVDCVHLCCRPVAEELYCNLTEPPVVHSSFSNGGNVKHTHART